MSVKHRKYLVVISILIVVCLLVLKVEKAKGKIISDIDFKSFPLVVDGWEGRDISLDESVYEILETRDVFIRRYKDKAGDEVELAVVYSGHDRQAFHPPEICYIGAGAQIINQGREVVSLGKVGNLNVNRLDMDYKHNRIKAWYWFLVGDRFVGNYYKQQLYFVWDALRGRKLQGALIRVSVTGESETLEVKAKSFIEKVAPYLVKTF